MKLEVFLDKFAIELQKMGCKYYDKQEIEKTAVFWELERIVRKLMKEDKELFERGV